MKTRTAVTVAFASASAVLVGWQFIASTADPNVVPSIVAHQNSSNTSAPTTPLNTPPTNTNSPSGTVTRTTNRTITGNSINTRYGSVQVEVTVSNGSISDVSALHLTDDGGRSVQISNFAAPILRSEVLKSQSAKVSMVGGATYTSEAYLSSLQSALDQLGG